MKIKLMIYSRLKDYVENYREEDGVIRDVSGGRTIRQFLQETINHEQAMEAISMVIVNDKVIPFHQLDQQLRDGDTVKVYPPMGGG